MSKLINSKMNEGERRIPSSSYFLIIIIFLILIVFLLPIKALIAEDFENKELLYITKVNLGDEVRIIYTHSVEKTDVTEVFDVGEKNLILMEERFSSFGAGLPADKIYPFKVTDDEYVLYDINKEMDEVVFRTGAIIANHRLIVNNTEIPFTDFSSPREAVSFKIKNIRIYKYFLRRCGFE